MEQAMEKRWEEIEAMIQQIPRVPTLLKKIMLHSYVGSLFIDSIELVEMPRKFSFSNMKLYDGTTDLIDHIVVTRVLNSLLTRLKII